MVEICYVHTQTLFTQLEDTQMYIPVNDKVPAAN